MHHLDALMKTDSQSSAKSGKPVRITVTIPFENYERVQTLAKKNEVSAAWVVRQAVEEYLNKDLPLLTQR